MSDSSSRILVNTTLAVVTAVVIALLAWIGGTVQETAVRVARIETAADASMLRAASTERDLLDLRTRVSAVEIELAKLKR